MSARLEVVFAAEALRPPTGGAERFALELLDGLRGRGHAVREVGAEPASRPAEDRYWRTRTARGQAVARALTAELTERPAGVVVSQLHAGPWALAAARRCGASRTALLLPSYEALCKHAFDADGACGRPPPRGRDACAACPARPALSPPERAAFARAGAAQADALVAADVLVAPSEALAGAHARWSGRRPAVVWPVVGLPAPRLPAPDGHILLVAARWTTNKGRGLLEPLAHALAPRRVHIAGDGLDDALRDRLQASANVTLRPSTSIETLLDGAALLLVPSQWEEPFGRVAVEGMAAGVPTLASRAGGLPEFVPAALLVDDRASVAAWAAAARRVLRPAAWTAARDQGLAAARIVAAADPVGAFEELLSPALAVVAE